jgi:hypothetical protein
VTHPTALEEFKNAYSLEFLSMQDGHSEADLHGALLRNLGRFITELGRDFCFVGSEYPVQVGKQDFAIDLVFFHRALQCLVAFELTVEKFKPANLGQLSFYVEALDRDVKKAHERPSIGVLLCATKDDEVVEYALARTASPTLVAEYQTMLPVLACPWLGSTAAARPSLRISFARRRPSLTMIISFRPWHLSELFARERERSSLSSPRRRLSIKGVAAVKLVGRAKRACSACDRRQRVERIGGLVILVHWR